MILLVFAFKDHVFAKAFFFFSSSFLLSCCCNTSAETHFVLSVMSCCNTLPRLLQGSHDCNHHAVCFYLFSHGFSTLGWIKSLLQIGGVLQTCTVLESRGGKPHLPPSLIWLWQRKAMWEMSSTACSLSHTLSFFKPICPLHYLSNVDTWKFFFLFCFFLPLSPSLQHVQGFTKHSLFQMQQPSSDSTTHKHTFLDVKKKNGGGKNKLFNSWNKGKRKSEPPSTLRTTRLMKT